jgi:hypothetical protein
MAQVTIPSERAKLLNKLTLTKKIKYTPTGMGPVEVTIGDGTEAAKSIIQYGDEKNKSTALGLVFWLEKLGDKTSGITVS